MKNTHPEEIAGSFKKLHALVLDVVPHQENDLILSCLTAEFGKISCFARSARKSKKRFPPGLMQPLNHLFIQLRLPRGYVQGRSEMWTLDSAELKATFPHLKTSYVNLEWIAHFLRLVKDTLPADHADPYVFRALGRVLRDSELIVSAKAPRIWPWFFAAFWTWFSKHLGWGEDFTSLSLGNDNADLMWQAWVRDDEFEAKRLLQLLDALELRAISQTEWRDFYRTWSMQSQHSWIYFEKWLGLEIRAERGPSL